MIVNHISSTLNAIQRLERGRIHGISSRSSRKCMPTTMPVHLYKMYKETRLPSMLETELVRSTTNGSEQLKHYHERHDTSGEKFQAKQTTVVEKTLVLNLQDIGVPPNQIIQITGHKNLQSVNNYSSLREKQIESTSRILSSASKASTNDAQTENNLRANPLAEYRIASTSTILSTFDVNSFKRKMLQTMFHENNIRAGVLNIN